MVDAYGKIHAQGRVRSPIPEGYTRVFSSRMHTDDMDPRSTNSVVQEFMIRPVLFDATSEDLTEEVRLALNIPEAPVVPEMPVEGPAPTDAGDPAGVGTEENAGG